MTFLTFVTINKNQCFLNTFPFWQLWQCLPLSFYVVACVLMELLFQISCSATPLYGCYAYAFESVLPTMTLCASTKDVVGSCRGLWCMPTCRATILICCNHSLYLLRSAKDWVDSNNLICSCAVGRSRPRVTHRLVVILGYSHFHCLCS